MDKKAKIIIIDDDRCIRDIYTTAFEMASCAVRCFHDGLEALQKVKDENPDAIVLDLVMPGLDGKSVLKQMRDDAELRKIPVIIVSNVAMNEVEEDLHSLGACRHLDKCLFRPDEICAAVLQCVGCPKDVCADCAEKGR